MSSKRNEELFRLGIEATNRGDLEGVLALFDPEIESRVGPGLANAGTWRGIDGYVGMITSWNEAFAEMRLEVGAVEFPDDDHLIAEINQTALGAISGVPVQMTIYFLFEVQGALAVRFHIYPDRAAAIAAVAE